MYHIKWPAKPRLWWGWVFHTPLLTNEPKSINKSNRMNYIFIQMEEIYSYIFTRNCLMQFIKAIFSQLGCTTTKLLTKRHLAVFCISLRWQRVQKKEEIIISYQAVFCIDRTAKLFYDYVDIFKQGIVHKLRWQEEVGR